MYHRNYNFSLPGLLRLWAKRCHTGRVEAPIQSYSAFRNCAGQFSVWPCREEKKEEEPHGSFVVLTLTFNLGLPSGEQNLRNVLKHHH